MPAEGRENPLLKKGNSDAFFREKYLTKNISKGNKVSSGKRMPDFAYIHRELLRNGGSKKFLWTEYMEECCTAGEEPLMYS